MLRICKISIWPDIALSHFIPWTKCVGGSHYGHFGQLNRYGKVKNILPTSEHIQPFVVKSTGFQVRCVCPNTSTSLSKTMINLINSSLSSSESRSPVSIVVVMSIYANESQLTLQGAQIYVWDIVHWSYMQTYCWLFSLPFPLGNIATVSCISSKDWKEPSEHYFPRLYVFLLHHSMTQSVKLQLILRQCQFSQSWVKFTSYAFLIPSIWFTAMVMYRQHFVEFRLYYQTCAIMAVQICTSCHTKYRYCVCS